MSETTQAFDITEFLERAKNGDKYAENEIVQNNMGLVWSVVKKFYNRGHEAEDLFQVGCIGLIRAVQRFDAGFDVKFSTYAVPMIMGEIKRFIRDDGIIKVSRSLKELSGKASAVKEVLQRKLGREPTISEIAEKLNVSSEELLLAMEAGLPPESLYSTVDDGSREGKMLMDRIESDDDFDGEIINKLMLKEALSSFDTRERQIIVLRYFQQKTQSQIADMLGISQVQVSRIEKRVLSQMRDKISMK